ncbi:hypothetical protein ACFL6S_27135 [Candidatus Poribacteria bacterium]
MMTDLIRKLLVLCFGTILLIMISANVWSLEVTDVQSSDGKQHELVEDGMKEGDLLCTDRAYTITGVPDKFKDIVWIRTANDSKTTPDLEISFDVDVPVYVYIVWVDKFGDAIAGVDWMKDYEDTGDDIMILTNPPDQPMSVYRSEQTTGPGTVTTYNIGAASHMYFIMIEGTSAPVELEGKLATTWAAIKSRQSGR